MTIVKNNERYMVILFLFILQSVRLVIKIAHNQEEEVTQQHIDTPLQRNEHQT